MKNIQSIFSVPIYKAKLNLDVKILKSFCKDYQQKENKGREISNVGGYQSSYLDLKNTHLQFFIKEIEKHATLFSRKFINRHKQSMRHLWFNVNKYNDYNSSHDHPGCTIAGTYYLKTPKNCGEIIFEHPAQGTLKHYNRLYYDHDECNPYNSEAWSKEPIEDMLYLFPSYLYHSVSPNENKKEERISVSFNMVQEEYKPKTTSTLVKDIITSVENRV